MGSDVIEMPTTVQHISLEWLQSIFDDAHIASFTVTNARLNETTSKIYITLSYDEEDGEDNKKKPRYIMLKGGFNPDMFAVPGYKDLLLRVYTHEVDFFTRAVPQLQEKTSVLEVPKVYWAGTDPGRQAVLAMEDLGPEGAGFVFGDATKTYSLDAVLSGVDQLAALHAATWGKKAEDEAWLQTSMYDETMRGLLEMWDVLVLAEDRPPLPDIIKGDRKRTTLALENYFRLRNPRFRCLLHGDPHNGNTYLDPAVAEGKPGRIRFLDWQITHVGSCFHDLDYFFVSMLTVEERRQHELAILDHYLQSLATYGGPVLSREDDPDVMIEFRRAMITGLGWVLTPYAMQKEERVRAMVARYAAAIVDHKTIELLTEE